MGGGLIPLPPARRRTGGEGNLGPLRRSKLAGKRGAEGKDGRLKEKRWMREGGRRGSLRVPPTFPTLLNPEAPAAREEGTQVSPEPP